MPALALAPFHDPALSEQDLLARLTWLQEVIAPRLERYLGYYRNPTTELSASFPCPPATSFSVRPFRQYQELGLPARITGFRRSAQGNSVPEGALDVQRKEVVIENDIAWRINTLVDFAAGRMPVISSTARDPATRRRLTAAINSLLKFGEHDGTCGLSLLQHLVLQGAISGSAWIHLRPSSALLARLSHLHLVRHEFNHAVETGNHDGGGTDAATPGEDSTSEGDIPATATHDAPIDVGQWLALEVVEAARLCPLPHAGDPCPDHPAYVAVLHSAQAERVPPGKTNGLFERVRAWFLRAQEIAPAENFSFDLFGPTHWQRYTRGDLVQEHDNLLGVIPFVRFESAEDPAAGSRVGTAGSGAIDVGLGDVEPLIGLQDELNTRLSDRASRVTMTCFRMYLGRGIEDFIKRPVGPGQMWATDNPNASIESFGGDPGMPSEQSHIEEIREALDKISGVSPVAAGLVRGKLGNLTSAVALRLTLIALLARTERKRAALTKTLATTVRLALAILDRADILPSHPDDRHIDVNWPTALPESDMDRLQEAQTKLALGIPRGVVLSELGYGELTAIGAAPAA